MPKTIAFPEAELVRSIQAAGVIPVLGNSAMTTLLELVKISYRSGIRLIEFMHQRDFRGLRLFSWLREETKHYHDLAIGVGTVHDADMAERYILSGADFIASPFLQQDMGDVCRRHGVLWIPGCYTMGDVEQASELGASVVTILSGNISGPEFLKQITREFPHMMLIPFSGVQRHENNLQCWFDAGAICVRLGDALFSKEAVAIRDWVKLENRVFSTRETISRIKASQKQVKTISIL